MMDFLETKLRQRGIAFDREGNRGRYVHLYAYTSCFDTETKTHNSCFPHVVNIAVQTSLKDLTSIPDCAAFDSRSSLNVLSEQSSVTSSGSENGLQPRVSQVQYDVALSLDPVQACRDLVGACRASGQRREDFRATIVQGNKEDAFSSGPLPCLQLLRDVETRWSSTFFMIDRVLELYQVHFHDLNPEPFSHQVSGN
jgi:hypothetical protein